MKPTAVAAVVLALALAAPAFGTPITGKYLIEGTDIYNATSIDFTNPGIVFVANGALSIMLTAPFVNLDNITFATPTGTLFDFSHLGTNIDVGILTLTVLQNSPRFLNITGTELITMTGFDPTVYDFSLTSTETDGVIGYASPAAPSAVPEPATLFLMGTGLMFLAVGLFRKKIRGRQQLIMG